MKVKDKPKRLGRLSLKPLQFEEAVAGRRAQTEASAMDAKQIVYRYNGVADTDEVVEDLEGDITIPNTGDVVERKDGKWKVHSVQTVIGVSVPKPIPVYRVYLTNKY